MAQRRVPTPGEVANNETMTAVRLTRLPCDSRLVSIEGCSLSTPSSHDRPAAN